MGSSVRGSAGEERQVGQKTINVEHQDTKFLKYHLGLVLNDFLRNFFWTMKYWGLGYIHGIDRSC